MLPLIPKIQTIAYLVKVTERLTLQAMQLDPRDPRVIELIDLADQIRGAIEVIRGMPEDGTYTDTPEFVRCLP
jgi:hypothetical protein